MFIIDSHCHLDLYESDEEIDVLVKKALGANVKYLQTICTRINDFPNLLSICKKYDNVFCSVGVHPCNVSTKSDIVSYDTLVKLAKGEKVIGFGETGLDFYHEGFNKFLQTESLLNHIEASRILGLPVIIHARSADIELGEILVSEYKKFPFKALIHCFTSSASFANLVLDLGMYISISGIVTFKNATELQNIVKEVSLDRLLVETDAPYLSPVPYRGKRNEMSYITNTVDCIAKLKNLSFEEVAVQTSQNFMKLFDKFTNFLIL